MSSCSFEPSNIILAGACAVAPFFLVTGALAAIGFTGGGVAYGSLAAMWMSSLGNVPAGSLFAVLQSTGAIGLTGVLLSPVAIAFESATFVSVLYGIKRCSIHAPNITEVASSTSAHIRNAQQKVVGYTENYLANHPDVAEKINLYKQSIETCTAPYFSAFNKHSEEAIKALDENTRTHRENLMKNASSLLSTINSQETADLVRKHSKEGADKARLYTENAINAANSYLSTVNTQENIDFINKKSKEVLDALDENTRTHRENLIKSTSSLLSTINSQETADLVRKHSKEGADKARLYTENAINAANSYLSTVNTQENIDFISMKSQETLRALEEKTRAQRENMMRTANSFVAGFFHNNSE